jgi:hypothetical protein
VWDEAEGKLSTLRHRVPREYELRLNKKILTFRQSVFSERYKLGMTFRPLHCICRL